MSQAITVFGLDDSQDRALGFNRAEARYARESVSAADLEARLRAFLDSMRGIIGSVPAALGEYAVDTIELKLEVSAKGTVSLLGSGGELGGTGGITLTLKRSGPPLQPPPQAA
jgi:hypothetical protein